ncbi:hypothetical protein MGLY_28030 [Neomoorella glycerini]|uniref:Uncharacterized protein n=1 Tax=Neomoorella glycerini TaxID=55779 RepID=A0A6I5ZUR8_9FIRM|nr:Ig-like domain-containing protein [Moorella glycerini]QGP93395.1 hypothetical protein MGLY_28030 [Moorella glycerini]
MSMWFHLRVRNFFIKLAVLFAIAFLPGFLPIATYAAGIPVYQYDVNQSSLQGYVATYSGYYDWHDGGYPWRRYYKVFAYSPGLSPEYYYAGTLSLKSARGQFYVQAFNGNAWVNIQEINTWDGYNEYWRTLDYNIVLPFPIQQLRYVTYVSSWQGESNSHSCSIGSITYRVHLLGADQNTVQAAYNAANNAAGYAQNAYNAADAAKRSADQATANTTYNGQSAAYWAYQAAQGGIDTTPPTIQKVQGLNGATCTTTGTFSMVVQATDNRAGQLQARAQVDGGAWTGWYNIPGNAIPVTLSSSGAHTITVEVKDLAGNTSQATITAFRI